MTQSTPTLTKSPTSVALTPEQRASLIALVSQRYLDSMDLRDLERFFLDVQEEYLQDYTDAELLGEVEDYTDPDEFNALLEVTL